MYYLFTTCRFRSDYMFRLSSLGHHQVVSLYYLYFLYYYYYHYHLHHHLLYAGYLYLYS